MSLAIGPQCCCDCPSKAETGLPDDLTLTFSVVSSSGTGIPTDEAFGECDGGDVYNRYEYNAAIAEAFGSIIYDYVEEGVSACSTYCCFHYEGRTNYTPTCPDAAPDAILLSYATPFEHFAIGSSVYEINMVGTSTADNSAGPYFWGSDPIPDDCVINFTSPAVSVDTCCSAGVIRSEILTCDEDPGSDYLCILGSDLTCAEVCGNFRQWSGMEYQPYSIYAQSDLYICVQGSVVTICVEHSITLECITRDGDGEVQEGYRGPCVDGECLIVDDDYTFTGTEGCATSASSILLTATADLSAVSGANLWEKIKNYTEWESDFESLHCNCGSGGCVDEYQRQDTECELFTSCLCLIGDYDETLESDQPIDRQCLYAVGVMGMTFSEAA